MSDVKARATSTRHFLYLLAAWVLLASGIGSYLLRLEYAEQLEYWRERLTRTADVNQRLLEDWLRERRGDARELASFMSVRDLVSEYDHHGNQFFRSDDLQSEINSFVAATTADVVYVLGRDGIVLASSSPSRPLAESVRDGCKSAKNDRVLTVFPANEHEYPRLAVLSPIFENSDTGVASGCVVILTFPEDIGSRISTDASSTQTGETVLASIRNNTPVFISALRNWDRTTAPPPLNASQATYAVLQTKAGVFGQFTDYRGVAVLAIGRFIPELQWAMITKLDRTEALANFQQSKLRAIAIVVLSTLFVVGIVVISWRRQRIQQLKAELLSKETAEEELRINEARMRLAFDTAQIGFWDWDIAHGTQVWSDACKTLLALPPDTPTNLEVLMSCVHPEDRDRMMASINDSITQKREHLIEYRAVWPDGSIHWQAAMGRVFFDHTGKATRMVGIAMNIDGRKQAEQRLQLQAAALEAAANSIVITDKSGNISWTNPAFTRLTGYTLEEVQGKNPRVLNSGQNNPVLYKNLWQTILKGDTWRGEIVNRRKDGTVYSEEQVITPVRSEDGEITHFIAIKDDITKRKQRDAELKQAEEKYRALFEDAMVGIYQSLPEGRFINVNPALAKICGYETPQELITEIHDLAHDWYVDPKRRDEFKRMLAKKGAIHDFEYQARRKDGSKIWLLQNAREVRGDHGNLMYYEGTVHDITERRSLEDQLRQAQKMEAVGRLAGGIAHDFNNALSVINGYSELLQMSLSSDETLKKQAGEIQVAGQRAATLTRQLLAFSRKQTIQPSVLDVNSVITELEKMLHRLIGEDVRLEITLGEQLWPIKVDQGQLEQVFMNLAVNSRDAMPNGGKLLIETCNINLDEMYVRRHPYAKAGAYVMLSISDTGLGMDKETQSRIFEPFFTTKEMGKGTGLGLSTVYGIVKQSQGYVSVYSEVGKGTTFKIFFPKSEGEAQVLPSRLAAVPASGHQETILLVEDDRSLRELTKRSLQNRGYKIIEAEDGKAGIEVARQYGGAIHLLLTDVIMPGLSGAELAKHLSVQRPDIKVLYMSGYTDDLIAYHGILDAGTMFIEKPFDLNSLLTKIYAALNSRKPNGNVGLGIALQETNNEQVN
jgi:two-component system, cell cycle sensor histidine kinase and response regulator CckA